MKVKLVGIHCDHMETTFQVTIIATPCDSLRLIATHCDSLRLSATPCDSMETRLYISVLSDDINELQESEAIT